MSFSKKKSGICLVIFIIVKSVAFSMDFEVMFSTPSLTGLVCGNNSLLNMTEDSHRFDSVSDTFNYNSQIFGDIHTWRTDITFAWSGGTNLYFQNADNINGLSFQLGVTGGIGLFFNYWESLSGDVTWKLQPLTGLSVFLYPIYEFPVIRVNGEPFWKWKSALELGLNYTVGWLSIYPYARSMVMFCEESENPGVAFDIGILIGIYFDDKQ